MMTFFSDNLAAIAALLVVVASVPIGFLARAVVIARLTALAERTKWRGDDAVVASLRRPLPFWFFVLGVYAAARIFRLPADWASIVDKTIASTLIISVTLWIADLGARLLQVGLERGRQGNAPVTGVLRNVVHVSVLAVGGLVLLDNLGISITPILTTLGVGGLAVALALQDTLANLFAGLHVTMAGNIRVGDFVKLESGEDGFVEDIQWRATRVRTLPNNFVLIPNSRLSQSVVTNYHRPSKDLAVLVQLGVHYASDLEHVERVACRVARDVMRTVAGGVPEFEPFIRFHTFGDSSINFTVILRAREYTDNFLVKHEFIKAVARAFAAEKIVIPFPIRAINLEQEGVRLERAPG